MSQVALITGGGSGIGLALVERLAAQGWRVYIVGRNRDKLQAVHDRFPESVRVIQADLESITSAELIAEHIEESTLDVLVHNAAIIDPMESIRTVNVDVFEKIMRINVSSCLRLTQVLLNKLNGGRVLFLSSGAAVMPLFEWSPYCTSKAALRMLRMCFQSEVSEVAFSDVKPGIVATPMLSHVMGSGTQASGPMSSLNDNNQLIQPDVVGAFLKWILTDVTRERYSATEWDIYDTSHHSEWLTEGEVPPLPV